MSEVAGSNPCQVTPKACTCQSCSNDRTVESIQHFMGWTCQRSRVRIRTKLHQRIVLANPVQMIELLSQYSISWAGHVRGSWFESVSSYTKCLYLPILYK